jgi:eukaryotic-like serine/threonine-protein kinase
MTHTTPTSNPILHNRYRIEEQLGIGRLAVVYRAYDARLQRRVLVHLLRKELADQEPLSQRFIREAHDSARRSHPSLLEVFDSGEVGGRPYMVTEYVAGRALRELGALSLEQALLYFRQVVGAVAVCQLAGVPYPPISSNNVILVEDGHVELVESWLSTPATIALDVAAYRPPERSSGAPITPAGAVYSLGLLLFEMLTGRRAIDGDDPRTVAQAHQSARIPSLSEVRPLLHIPALERLLQQTTARRPEDRPPDAAALGLALDDLRRAIARDTQQLEAPPVRPPTLRQRINRTTGALVAPRAARPAPVDAEAARGGHARRAPAPDHAPAQLYGNPRRSISGMVVLLTLLLVVACGAYYSASIALGAMANIQLPRPELDLPSLPDLGIELPEWLTGVVSGGGQTLVVDGVPDEGLNLRAAPGLKTEVIGLLPNGARVRKIGESRSVDGVPWLPVRARLGDQEREGWVSELFVKPE